MSQTDVPNTEDPASKTDVPTAPEPQSGTDAAAQGESASQTDLVEVEESSAETDVRDSGAVQPQSFALEANYPNPFNAATTISFTLANPGQTALYIYDIQGRLVRQLLGRFLPAGTHQISWNGKSTTGIDLASGTYLYQLETTDRRESRKMLLLR